ncbi:glycosyltransferase [Muricauda sp. JGD-17]|uniref:Glycosyltransferase n=1 Tax=Flagellimonas ochracea TaxID=2696472 RepID=A0A964TBF8_9FLAO|nr:glycosyltransferase family 4 protein [Allomuricauda ochracea]NAY91071.1 glycosyltransferase [Allomuricauda ochracea]
MQKILVITYYWPPAGGPGVQRWLKFVKYLPDFGVEPLVYVPQNPDYPIIDEQLVADIPEGVRVISQPIQEPYRWASLLSKSKTKRISAGMISEKNPSLLEKLLLWVRGNLFIPDARKFWVKPSIRFLSSLIEKEKIEIIITTGPPHSLHLIGLGLKKRFKLQWIADFRDPWTSIGYQKKLRLTRASQKKHERLEREVLTTADKIVVTSPTTKKEFENITDKPMEVITNGFDEELFPVHLDGTFSISHLGSLLTGRNPISLWEALSELIQENDGFGSALKIKLAGVVGGETLSSLEDFKLTPYLELMGYLSHDKVVEVQQKSQVLLLLEIDSEETQGIIPGKLFEYLNAKRPILAIGPKDWAAGTIIEETQSGTVCAQGDKDTIKTVLLDWFADYEEGKLQANSKHVDKYHRKKLTEALTNFIRWELS